MKSTTEFSVASSPASAAAAASSNRSFLLHVIYMRAYIYHASKELFSQYKIEVKCFQYRLGLLGAPLVAASTACPTHGNPVYRWSMVMKTLS